MSIYTCGSRELAYHKTMEKFLELKTKKEFASFFHIKENSLNNILRMNGKDYFYTVFSVPKKNGSTRTISAPKGNLLTIQKRLNIYITKLYLEFGKKDYVHGFVPERDIVSNAKVHLRRDIYNIDLEDFFGSITYWRVYRLFLSRFRMTEEVSKVIASLVTYNKTLPQGAPTSPMMTNLICHSMDIELRKFARENGLIYTRYADDLTFSKSMDSGSIYEQRSLPLYYKGNRIVVNERIRTTIERCGFKINIEKLRISGKGNRKEVTGITVNEKLNVNRDYIRMIRSKIHYLKVGLSRKNSVDKDEIQKQVRAIKGYINFVKYVRGKDDILSNNLALKLNTVLNREEITVDTKSLPQKYIEKRTVLINPKFMQEFDINNGTGFILNYKSNQYLVTCDHVFDDSDSLSTVKIGYNHVDSSSYNLSLFKRDNTIDVAVYKLRNKLEFEGFTPPKNFKHYKYRLDQELYYIGFPDYNYNDTSITDRLNISKIFVSSNSSKSIRNIEMWEVSPPMRKGGSGGPILNLDLEVVGMTANGPGKDSSKEGLDIPSAFIPIRIVLEFIDDVYLNEKIK